MLQYGAHVLTRLPTTCGPKFPARAPPFPASFRTCSVHVSVHVSQRRWTQPLARRPITDAPSAPSFLSDNTRSKVVLAFCGLKSSLFLNLVSCYSKILAFRNRDGIVDVVSEYCSLPRTRRHIKKRQQFQTVEMKVRIDCEGCERKVKKALEDMKGVSSVEVTAKQNKVTVTGYVDAAKVMRRVAYKTGKRVEPWPYVPYETVAHPYAPGAYDKRAPAGYVRNVVGDPSAAPLARASSTEARYTAAFSDENPNACSVM